MKLKQSTEASGSTSPNPGGIAFCRTGDDDGENGQLSICPRLLTRGWIVVGARRSGWGRSLARRMNIDRMSDENNNQTRDEPELIQKVEVSGWRWICTGEKVVDIMAKKAFI